MLLLTGAGEPRQRPPALRPVTAWRVPAQAAPTSNGPADRPRRLNPENARRAFWARRDLLLPGGRSIASVARSRTRPLLPSRPCAVLRAALNQSGLNLPAQAVQTREPSTSTSAARAASSAERRASSARCCASGVTLYSRATGVTGGTGAIKGGLDIVQSVLGRVNNELSEPFATTGDMTIAE